MLKTLTVALAFTILALVVAAAGSMPASAQSLPAKPAGVTAADGARPGEVTVSWQAVDGAALYRIGWVAFDDITAVQNAGRPWLDAFAFTDVTNYRQTTHRLKDLTPGVRYAFIVGSINSRFSAAAWSQWAYLTPAEAPGQCPAGAGNPPAPQPDATPTPAPTATPDPNATPTPTPDPNATPTATPQPDAAVTPTPTPVAVGVDYDRDDNGLIEITNLAQLDAIRDDLDGDGAVLHTTDYEAAFPNAATGMGCFRSQCKGYELVANLDFDTNRNGHIDEGDAYWDDGAGWYPIGEIGSSFNAVLEGNGHTIANLYIDWTDTTDVGLFRRAGRDAVIRNLTLTQVYVVGGAERIGALAGWNGGQIVNSHISGEVTGGAEVGGLAGRSSGTISSSSSSATITATGNWIGGLIGSNAGAIATSYATGNVTSNGSYIGGLAGYVGNNGTIVGSYATGNVTSDGSITGGLVGGNHGTITGSYATGNTNGKGIYFRRHEIGIFSRGTRAIIGGLVGYNTGAIATSHATGDATGESSIVGGLVGYSRGSVSASYAVGNATGTSQVGGLIGRLGSDSGSGTNSIDYSYAVGNASGTTYVAGLFGYTNGGSTVTESYAVGKVSADSNAGGLTASGNGSVIHSFWDTQTTGQPQVSRETGRYGAGKTTREMQRPTGPTGIYADWDPEYWDFGTSRQYPALKYDGMDVAAQRQ